MEIKDDPEKIAKKLRKSKKAAKKRKAKEFVDYLKTTAIVTHVDRKAEDDHAAGTICVIPAGEHLAIGSTICHPLDDGSFNYKMGAEVAFKRAVKAYFRKTNVNKIPERLTGRNAKRFKDSYGCITHFVQYATDSIKPLLPFLKKQ